MFLCVLAFTLGIVWLQWQPALLAPDIALLSLVGGVLLGGSLVYWARADVRAPWVPSLIRRAALRMIGLWLISFCLGLAWANGRAQLRLADALPSAMEGQDLVLRGVIASMPQRIERGWRFDFAVEAWPLITQSTADSETHLPKINATANAFPQLISLAWYTRPLGRKRGASDGAGGEASADGLPPALHAGQRWEITVRLKRPHGNLNPYSFDYEGWLLERGIRATGYVRPTSDNALLDPFVLRPITLIERAREQVRESFFAALPDSPYAPILVALAVGDQQAIEPNQWETFSRTGITHLMSISGLHVTMLASLAYALMNLLWRRAPWLMRYLPAQQAAIVAGLCAALLYCLIAGFAVPAQRTLYMLTVVALALWFKRNLAVRHVLALALLLVLLLDPWAVLAAGFWLSFGAVGLLFYISSGRLGEAHWFNAWLSAQWALTVGMVPLLLLLFQQFSLVSPIANAIAIPVVSFIVTPLALLSTVPLLSPLLSLANTVLAVLMSGMEWLASLPFAIWQQHSPSPIAVVLAVLGMAWMLLPKGFPARWLGLVTLLPLFFLAPERPEAGEMRVTTLDVGQGLAVHVQTYEHDLLFDTGPAFSDDANSGNRIILPYLRAVGVASLDGLVVSHADNDHAGGAEAVVAGIPVAWMETSVPFEDALAALPVVQQPCMAGQTWTWDGVVFNVLHPTAEAYDNPSRKTNDMSCVLKLTSAHGSMLLTGDIEALSEQALLARYQNDLGQLKSDVLIVPHHGSKTSSTREFIDAVGAKTVIYPVGYRNRFAHPRPEVLARYAATGAQAYRTDLAGAVTVDYRRQGLAIGVERSLHKRYWHDQ